MSRLIETLFAGQLKAAQHGRSPKGDQRSDWLAPSRDSEATDFRVHSESQPPGNSADVGTNARLCFLGNAAETGAQIVPPFPLVCPLDTRYSPRINTVVVAVYQRHPCSDNESEYPSASQGRAIGAAVKAADPS